MGLGARVSKAFQHQKTKKKDHEPICAIILRVIRALHGAVIRLTPIPVAVLW